MAMLITMVVAITTVPLSMFIRVTLVTINATKMVFVLSLATVMTANVKMGTREMAKNVKILMNVRKNFTTVIVMQIVPIMKAVIPVPVLMDSKVMDFNVLRL